MKVGVLWVVVHLVVARVVVVLAVVHLVVGRVVVVLVVIGVVEVDSGTHHGEVVVD